MRTLSVGLLGGWVLALAGSVAAAEKPPISVAVLDFTAASPDAELVALGKGLGAMLATDLATVKPLQLVERQRLHDVTAELQLADSGLVDPATAAKAGELAGATYLVSGMLTVAGDRMRIDARLVAVASGEVAVAEKIEGAKATFFDLEKALARKVVDGVGVKLNKAAQKDLARSQTSSFVAVEHLGRGLAALDQTHYDEAQKELQAAVAADPQFALAQATLAQVDQIIASLPPPAPPSPPPGPPASSGGGAMCCCPNPSGGACGGTPVGPLATPPSPSTGAAPPAAPLLTTFPVTMGCGGDQHFLVRAEAAGQKFECVTPCLMQLPSGKVRLAVRGPSSFEREIDVPAHPVAVCVTGKRLSYWVTGGVLAVGALAGLVAGIYGYAGNGSSGTSFNNYDWWPLPLAIAALVAAPAAYLLLHAGTDRVDLLSF